MAQISLLVDDDVIHQKLIEKTGGMSGVGDFAMLESAVYSTMQAFGEEDVYTTAYERSARLAYAITSVADGSKGYHDIR